MPNVNKSTKPRTALLLMVAVVLCSLGRSFEASAQSARPRVEIRTRYGTMVVELYNETPEYRDRFISRVNDGSLDSLLIHRVVPGFAIEGGDPGSKNAAAGLPLGLDPDTVGLPLMIIPGLIHRKGALAAAPAGDTPELGRRSHRDRFFFVLGEPFQGRELDRVAGRNTALGAPFAYTEQDRRIYATAGGQPRLDGSYTVFGEVVEGLDVLDAMAKAVCNTWDRPMEDILMYTRSLP